MFGMMIQIRKNKDRVAKTLKYEEHALATFDHIMNKDVQIGESTIRNW